MFRNLLINLHKATGILLSLLFLMWFASGIVMIHHSFPRVSPQARTEVLPTLRGTLPDMEEILSIVPDSVSIRSLRVEMFLDTPVACLQGRDYQQTVYLDTFESLPDRPDFTTVDRLARAWCLAPVLRVDTLYKLDQWIPFGRIREELPVYKYLFDDQQAHQLYISSRSGRVLQFTDKDQRFWAWLGAIPHWVYFTSLRRHQAAWSNFVKWTSGIGCIMVLIGMILGIYRSYKNRGKGITPYKKRWFRWHHVSGLIFGLFALTFAFSGLMSMTGLPGWMSKKPAAEHEAPLARGARQQRQVSWDRYELDYRSVIAAFPETKSIRWAAWEGFPYYEIITDEKTVHLDASLTEGFREFQLTEELIRGAVQSAHGEEAVFSVESIDAYDKDYFALPRKNLPLPVYRVILEDDLHTRYYYNPETLTRQQIDDNGRLRRFLYRGLHSLHIKFLTDRPVLWNIVMYTLMIGGTFLSLTGVVLSFNWLSRKLRRVLRKINR